MNRPLTIPMLTRGERLRDAGLSYQAIATVLALDYDRPVNKDTLRGNLRRRGVPPDTRRMTANNNLRRAA